jgi:hypothetical protein
VCTDQELAEFSAFVVIWTTISPTMHSTTEADFGSGPYRPHLGVEICELGLGLLNECFP